MMCALLARTCSRAAHEPSHPHPEKTHTHTLSVSPGCLWARKGSHREPLRSQLVRTEGAADPANTSGLRAKIAPKEINVDGADAAGLSSAKARGWLGKVPGHESLGADSVTYSPATEAALREAGFVPLPVKAGDLVSFLCPHALFVPPPPLFPKSPTSAWNRTHAVDLFTDAGLLSRHNRPPLPGKPHSTCPPHVSATLSRRARGRRRMVQGKLDAVPVRLSLSFALALTLDHPGLSASRCRP